MSDFLVNLVRRGAGLAPEMSPKPVVGLNSSALLAEAHHGVAEKGLESEAEDRLERTRESETSRSMMIQRLPASAGSVAAGLTPRNVEAPLSHRNPLSSGAVSSPISAREGTSRPGPRPGWTTTAPRSEEDPHEHRIHGPRRPETFQAVERDVLLPRNDTSSPSEKLSPGTLVEKRERSVLPEWQTEQNEPPSPRDVASASGFDVEGRLRDPLASTKRAVAIAPRLGPSWDPGSPPARLSAPQAAPGAEASTTRIQVRIGRIEIRVVKPPAQPTPAPTHKPGGFAEYTLARRYLDRVWY